MAKPTGFLEYERKTPPKRPVAERIRDFKEIEQLMTQEELLGQAARCMDCGVPSCHAFGCPLGNVIPEWNDMVYRGQWRKALELLHSTNNFPEFTGRICPALCEGSCTLMIHNQPVAIRQIELQIVERGWREGWITPEPPAQKSGFKVAVIGSGPSGLAAAQQLARAGHKVTVFERDEAPGGLLRYGIPDYKLPKAFIDRRLEQMKAEGVRFETRVEVGKDISAAYLTRGFDAIVLATGSRVPRNLDVPGRELLGVHFALEFLGQQNRRNAGIATDPDKEISACGKNVVVIGGGDTGSDCIGTARRQQATSVVQLEILPQPPEKRVEATNPWPTWPLILRTSTSHEEGCLRMFSVATHQMIGDEQGHVRKLECMRAENFREVPGTGFELEADLVLLAMGFVHTEHGPLVQDLGLKTDGRGNLAVDAQMMTSAPGVFAAGDAMKGQSLVVHAINLGRKAAEHVDAYLSARARQ